MKIHLSVDIHRIFPEDAIDDAGIFYKFTPVGIIDKAEAAYTIADGNLICCLFLIFTMHQCVRGEAIFRQTLFNPCQWQCQRRAFTQKPSRKFGNKRTCHRRIGSRHVSRDDDKALGIFFRNLSHAVCPIVSEIFIDPVAGHRSCEAAQVFDQGKTEHNGDCPKLAEF